MPLLLGKLVIACPKTGAEIDARNTCVDCKSFKHISWRGIKPYITCTYEVGK